MKSRLFLAIGVLTVFAIIFSACTPAPTPQVIEVERVVTVEKPVIQTVEKEVVITATPASRVPAGQIVVGESAFWNDLNPLTLADAKGLDLFVTEPLFTYNREDWSKMEPRLAESWNVSQDGMTYTFQLRKNVKFTDGTAFTANDVLFTFETAMKPETAYAGRASLDSIAKLDASDDFTFVITLKAPSAVFLASLSTFGIVPKHLLEGQDLRTTGFSDFPVGTGPFVVTEHNAEFLVFEANPDYWGDPPGAGKIIFKTAPDAAARSAMLRSGEIDLTRYEYQTQSDLVGRGYNISRSLMPGWMSCEVNLKNPLFSDTLVRQALLYAIDRDALLKATFLGNAMVASGPIIPEDWAYEADVIQYTYDLDKAAELMIQAGWKKNTEGIWEKDGKTFTFALMAYKPNPSIFNSHLILQEYWNEFGMDVSVDVTPDWSTWWDRFIKGDFAAGVMDWGYGTDPDGISASFVRGGSANGGGYENAELEKLLEQGRTTLDREGRKRIYSQIQKIMAEELPTLWLAWEYRGIIMKDSVIATYDPIKDFYANAYWWRLSK